MYEGQRRASKGIIKVGVFLIGIYGLRRCTSSSFCLGGGGGAFLTLLVSELFCDSSKHAFGKDKMLCVSP